MKAPKKFDFIAMGGVVFGVAIALRAVRGLWTEAQPIDTVGVAIGCGMSAIFAFMFARSWKGN